MKSGVRLFSLGLFGVLVVACSSEEVFFGAAEGGAGSSSLDTSTSSDAGSSSSSTGMGGASSAEASSSVASSSAASSSVSPCGNNALDMGETCDDGNMVAGDGCGATCAIEGSFSKCPSKYGGVGFALVDKLVFSGSTVGLSNITKTACGGNSADDAIFEVMPAKTGNVQVVFTPLDGFQAPIIGFRGGCTTVPLGCNEVNPQLGYSATRGVTAGVPLYVILTGSSGSEGPYTLSLAYL